MVTACLVCAEMASNVGVAAALSLSIDLLIIFSIYYLLGIFEKYENGDHLSTTRYLVYCQRIVVINAYSHL